jgi:type IV pilus assembly protein PilB
VISAKRRVGEKLGQILVRNGSISEEQLQRALDLQKREGGLLGEILVKLGYVDEQEIVQALTAQYGFAYLPLENYEPNEKGTEIVPENVARQYSIIPVDIIGDLLTIVMANPLNEKAIEDIEMITKKKVQVFISTATSIHEAINKLYKKPQAQKQEKEQQQ